MARPVTANIKERSAPCGYFVFTAATSIRLSFLHISVNFAIASGLLSSIPITPLALGNKESIILRPEISCSGISIIQR